MGLNDIKGCVENPTGFDCVMAAIGIIPWGKLKLVTKLDDGLDAIRGLRAARRSVSCLAGAAHSFPAGTKVLMADGTSRSIEQIRTGDLVTATDPVTGETAPAGHSDHPHSRRPGLHRGHPHRRIRAYLDQPPPLLVRIRPDMEEGERTQGWRHAAQPAEQRPCRRQYPSLSTVHRETCR
ncbi:hypothetical protein MTQ10_29980 [Streptomyces sp. XM83C]|uniref:hypothetical protein n=1 Tax=Streptomyces sp. XM83C TaxID=2929781 RepID=UPI001FF8F67C|nr:hypothetical protein [Streptomyces sp. XM83C]MCK1823696.1 hypothetical protein [Streptomyces sp. XM83C]